MLGNRKMERKVGVEMDYKNDQNMDISKVNYSYLSSLSDIIYKNFILTIWKIS